MSDVEWREAMYRQLARQSGLPAGLRPEMIKRAEVCVARSHYSETAFFAQHRGVEGCKGAISR